MPPPILPTVPCCQELANQRKPEAIANVNKHMKGTVLSDTLRKVGILADKTLVSLTEYAYRICLPVHDFQFFFPRQSILFGSN